jgi:type VI secretion system protein ImpE
MNTTSMAERSLHDGDPAAALSELQEQVRTRPADAKLRIFLFQLLVVLGQWERARSQLEVAASLDPAALAMAQTYREAILCELLRAQVFEGKKSPLVLGQPEAWLGLLIESVLKAAQGEQEVATRLHAEAFEQAPESTGSLNGSEFAWIADADSRLGPVLEAIINGRYYWVPFAHLRRIVIEPPQDLRDYVWMPASLEFTNGGDAVALIPTRYPGSESAADPLIVLGRKTEWIAVAPDVFHGRGQRIVATDGGEHALMDVREVKLAAPAGV